MRFLSNLSTPAASRGPASAAPIDAAEAKVQQALPVKSAAPPAADCGWSIRAQPADTPTECSVIVLPWVTDCTLEVSADEAQWLVNPFVPVPADATAPAVPKPSPPRPLLRRAAAGMRSACRRLARSAGALRLSARRLAAASCLARPATATGASEASCSPQIIQSSP